MALTTLFYGLVLVEHDGLPEVKVIVEDGSELIYLKTQHPD